MTTESHQLKPLLWVMVGAICISFAPVFVKMLGQGVLGPTAIAFWRTLFGAIILFVWMGLRRMSLRMPWAIFKFTIIAGFMFYLDLSVWHRSIIYSGAGIATILGNTQVFWMALIGFLIFKEKLSKIYLLAVVAAFMGVSLLVGVGSDIQFSTMYIRGIIFGLMTGVFYSGYMTSLKVAGHKPQEKRISFLSIMAWTSLFCALFTGVSMLIENDPYIPPDFYSYAVLFSLALVAQAAGWYIISSNLSKLRASQSGIVLLLQPTFATIWGALFFAERLTLLQIVGALITIGAIYYGSVRAVKKRS